MILDLLANHAKYHAMHPLFEEAFKFIETFDPGSAIGRFEPGSNGMYAMYQAYATQPAAGVKFEAHRKYIDIQYLVEGSENIYYAPIVKLTPGEYQPEKDYQPLHGEGQPIILRAGDFTIFFPQDAHMPGREIGGSTPVKKIVVKVPVN